jgi:hypothetical protein
MLLFLVPRGFGKKASVVQGSMGYVDRPGQALLGKVAYEDLFSSILAPISGSTRSCPLTVVYHYLIR